jgi:hypothetical protein
MPCCALCIIGEPQPAAKMLLFCKIIFSWFSLLSSYLCAILICLDPATAFTTSWSIHCSDGLDGDGGRQLPTLGRFFAGSSQQPTSLSLCKLAWQERRPSIFIFIFWAWGLAFLQAPYVICPTQSILSRFDPAPRRLANNNNNNGGPSVRAFGLVNFSRSNGLHLSTRVPFGPVCSSAPFLLLFFLLFLSRRLQKLKREMLFIYRQISPKKKENLSNYLCPMGMLHAWHVL